MYDSGLLGRTALTRAKKLLRTTKNEKQKKELQGIISRYERAMLTFSSDPEVRSIRRKAERKYLREGKVATKTFTDPQRTKAEREAAKGYGIKVSPPKRKTPPKKRPSAAVNLRGMIW